jgi:hypothetical protein
MQGFAVAKVLKFSLGGSFDFICAVFDDAEDHETTVIVTYILNTIRHPDHLLSQFQGREKLLHTIIAHTISWKDSIPHFS